MSWHDLRLRLRALLFRSRVESELDEELKFHLEMEARKHGTSGLDPADATRQAKVAFGAAERVKEECRDTRGTQWFDNFLQDLRFAFRLLRKDRGYAFTAIAALALGIGSNTALFTLFAATVLKPLPVPNPAGLVNLWRTTAQSPRGGFFSFADYIYYRDHNSGLAALAAETPAHLRLVTASGPSLATTNGAEPMFGLFITANYLNVFGIQPIAGRDFLPEEERQTAGPYPVLLSENYWDRRFGRNPSVLGQTLMLSGTQTVVIGITPRDFMGTRQDVPDAWVIASAFGDVGRRALNRNDLSCGLTGRLKPGVTRQQAQADLSVLASSLRQEYPQAERQWNVQVVPALRFGTNHQALTILFGILQVAMGLVLLIACTNVAGLLLGKSVTRRKEIAVRLSLGASRGRLVRQLVSEGVLMALLAGFASLLITWQALAAIGRVVSAALAVKGTTLAIDVTPDLHVFVYILTISILAGVSFSLAPALQSTRPDLVAALKDETAAFGVRNKGRLRGWLVASQIAVSLTLLIGAGLLTSSSVRMVSIDPGFETRSVLNLTVLNPQELGYSAARSQDLQRTLHDRLRATPGVVSVSFATRIPLGGNVTSTFVSPNDRPPSATGQRQFPFSYVSQDYFQTLGIPLLRGRAFTAQEIGSNAAVAVISEGLARRFWPDDDAIGKRISLGSRTEVRFVGRRTPLSPSTEVIGVAREVYSQSLTAPDAGVVYIPKPADEWGGLVFVRVSGDPSSVAGALIREIHGTEPNLAVSAETLEHMIATGEVSALYRVGAIVFTAIGLLGFTLASVGIYSIMAFSVSQQTREVGIRMALGAQRRDVLRLLLGAGLKWIVAGLLIGAGLGAILSRVLASQLLLEGQGFLDPAVIAAVSALTGLLALVAAYFPARRATKLDPALTLRFE
ncbi:MAG TPA: ABC transporter permease [Bryobacteraceae bacterium]|nr:ABC transporter permease [Bryobacteraceae bacterium]